MATATAVAAAAAKIVKLGGGGGTRPGSTAGIRIIHRSQLTFQRKETRPFSFSARCTHNNQSRMRILSFCSSAFADATTDASSTTSTEESNAAPSPEVSGTETAPAPGAADEKKTTVRDAGHLLDIRVGRILKAWRHEEADSLYVEEVDVGEAEPRIICSGLVKYVPLEELQDRNVAVLANLKPRNMRGVKSNGMLMAASDAAHENVELLEPPEGSVPGERIWFGSEDDKLNLPDPASPNQVAKKKIWESVQPHLKTNDSCVAKLEEHLMRTSAGVVTCRSLKNANIS
ncbi:hypothetical protein Tsubulata_050636 [Turnera subulata]|uniref:tRNA-binding domain-containing protein n=1 Tax=Turnera subulata TaxID=218843 RepID=A0A9Q0J5E0_9ROSI|nr:hypothetical protein Tsubulata_050636 [Turnera subulata]